MNEAILRQVGSPQKPAAGEPVNRGRSVIAVIGIDDYDVWPRLNNAVTDARGLRSLFLDDLNFIELTNPLYNSDATLAAINGLVQDDLMSKLTPDDSLVLFFAGHGHTLTVQVGETEISTGYLIPAGGRLENEGRFSSWLKLDSFLSDLSRLPARHVMTILDACYSGFALGQSVTVLRNFERYNTDLSRRFSRQLITSAQKDQPAHDNGPLPGHSLFTGTLIDALKSQQADSDRKGFVTGSELGLYVQKSVSSYSETTFPTHIVQTPGFGSFALHEQGELVIDLQGATQSKRKAQELYEVAEHVLRLGQLTGDPRRFAFAAAQYRAAIELTTRANLAYPEADLGLGKALFASGDYAQAVQELGKLIDREGQKAPADAWLFLGMAQAALQQPEAAAASLRSLLDQPLAHPASPWVQAFLDRLPDGPAHQSGRKLALLIGINRYQIEGMDQEGCVNDATLLLCPSLIKRCGFPPDCITVLTDQNATRQRILDELQRLVDTAAPQDTVLVHFSGHSLGTSVKTQQEDNPENIYLIVHDTTLNPRFSNGISVDALHEKMQAIRAGSKTLILDTHSRQELTDLAAREGTYALICASDSAEVAYESRVTIDDRPVPCGLLSGGLYYAFQRAPDPASMTYRDWLAPANEIIHWASKSQNFKDRQTPYFIGLPGQRVFGGEDPYQAAFHWVQTGALCMDGPQELARRYRWWNAAAAAPMPEAYAAFGYAFHTQKNYAAAIQAYQKALECGLDNPDTWRALGIAYLRSGDLSAARSAFEKYAPHADKRARQDIAAILETFSREQKPAPRVVLFLFGSHTISPATGEQIQKLLSMKYGRHFGFGEPVLEVHNGNEISAAGILDMLKSAGAKGPCLAGLIGAAADLNPSAIGDSLRSLSLSNGDRLDITQIESAVRRQPDLMVWVQSEQLLQL